MKNLKIPIVEFEKVNQSEIFRQNDVTQFEPKKVNIFK